SALIIAVSEDINLLSAAIDPWLWSLQILSAIVFFGMLAAALWNAWRVWKGSRRWPAKVWSVVLIVASLTVLWVALTFRLIGFGTDF
ncbi:MAG: serine hydrolase, partial [Sphingomonas sp.]|nr:serine hydrolase [Sphingomonas sp.]